MVVSIGEEELRAIFQAAKSVYPRETVLFLRGKAKKEGVRIAELVIPPLATLGHGFTNVPLHMLPMDFSLVGTVHSHPNGNLTPSVIDYNHFFGKILIIVGYPFTDERHIAAYSRDGEQMRLEITKT